MSLIRDCRIWIPALLLACSCTEYPSAERFVAPEIEKIEASVDGTEAVLLCRVSSYPADCIGYGFEYSDTLGNVSTVSGHDADMESGSFTCSLSGLESDMKYVFKAFLDNGTRRYESAVSEFLTEPCIVDDRFASPEFREFCISKFDTSGDGHLSLSEADKVTKLVLLQKVYSVEGIDVFRNLESFSCVGAAVDTLDLSGCMKLDRVSAVMSGIKSVLLPEMSDISYLDLSSNKLKNIDLECCPGLEYLDCNSNSDLNLRNFQPISGIRVLNLYDTATSDIDLDGFPNLEELTCGSSGFEPVSLSLKGCTSLKSLSVESLCSALDFSEFPALEKLDMNLCCNQLELDFASNLRLSELKIVDCDTENVDVSSCRLLKKATLWYTSVSALDFSRCRSLSALDCRYNKKLKSVLVAAGQEISIKTDPGFTVSEVSVGD